MTKIDKRGLKMFYTKTELYAIQVLGAAGQIRDYFTTFCKVDPHEAGNRLIEIAERIKAERAVAAMEEK